MSGFGARGQEVRVAVPAREARLGVVLLARLLQPPGLLGPGLCALGPDLANAGLAETGLD